MEIRITDLTHVGEGVGRADGKATFVPEALPGETVRVRITQSKKNWQRATLLERLTTSEDRIDPLCPLFGRCGGCQIQHLEYSAGLAWKENRVRALMAKAGVSVEVKPVVAMEQPWRYRNAMQLHRKGDAWGFHRAGTHDVIPVAHCPIQSDASNRVLEALQEIALPREVHRLSLRTNEEGSMLTVHSGSGKKVPVPEELLRAGVVSVWMEHKQRYLHLHGQETLPIRLGNVTYPVHPASFFQVNRSMAETLFGLALDCMGSGVAGEWLDLYCGIGALTLQAAPRVRTINGVDIEPNAIRNAKETAASHGIYNADFTCAASEQAVYDLLASKDPIGVFVDPPRAGLDPAVVTRLAQSNVERIVYISCDPATLARDCARFAEHGWHVGVVQPVDMFPWTTHVENVVLIQRVSNRNEACHSIHPFPV